MNNFECDLYLAPSTIPFLGRGVFTGREIKANETFHVASTVAMRYGDIQPTMLNNYVFGASETGISMAEMGPGMIYNHHYPPNYQRMWDGDEVGFQKPALFSDQKEAHTTFTGVRDIATKDFAAGEEIFGKYCEEAGPCDWFTDREMEFHDYFKDEQGNNITRSTIRSLNQLASEGHCITQVYTAPSTVPNAGRGLFASRSFEPGEIVTISPVLLLPVVNIDDGSGYDFSVLINYVMSIDKASIALLPFGMSGMANHAPSLYETPMGMFKANMKPEWFYWDESMTSSTLQNTTESTIDNNSSSKQTTRPTNKTLLELSQQPFTQLDLAFRALRFISEGEELLYSYGPRWQSTWNKYIVDLRDYHRKHRMKKTQIKNEQGMLVEGDYQHPPLFRTFIGDPENLFFPHWRDLEQEVNTSSFPTVLHYDHDTHLLNDISIHVTYQEEQEL